MLTITAVKYSLSCCYACMGKMPMLRNDFKIMQKTPELLKARGFNTFSGLQYQRLLNYLTTVDCCSIYLLFGKKPYNIVLFGIPPKIPTVACRDHQIVTIWLLLKVLLKAFAMYL